MRCHLCTAFSTSSLKALITHWRVFHNLSENSKYVCTLSKCGRKFTSINSFKRHFKLDHSSYFSIKVNPGSSSGINAANNSNSSTISESENTNNFSSACTILSNEDQHKRDVPVPSTSKDAPQESALSEIVECQIQRMISNFYSKPSIPRNVVQCIIDDLDNILTCPLKVIEDKVNEILIKNSVPLDDCNKVKAMFGVFPAVLQENRTEYLRFKNLRETELYIDPQSHIVGAEFEASDGRDVPKNRCAQVIPLRDILKAFLKTEGVLNRILKYISSVNSKSSVISNIMQAELWKETIKNFEGKICLPLALYFDEYETGNCLGFHSGIHKLGEAYIIMLALPPEFRSKLTNIFLAMLIHHDDHKKAGNKIAFAKLIEEFKYLAEEGIVVETDCKKIRIYFVLAVVEGDNQGLNTILGFSESFSATCYCR